MAACIRQDLVFRLVPKATSAAPSKHAVKIPWATPGWITNLPDRRAALRGFKPIRNFRWLSVLAGSHCALSSTGQIDPETQKPGSRRIRAIIFAQRRLVSGRRAQAIGQAPSHQVRSMRITCGSLTRYFSLLIAFTALRMASSMVACVTRMIVWAPSSIGT